MKNLIGCQWENSCVCNSGKSVYCEKCKWYFWVDSGYGYCKALPEHIRVGWCRDICSLFKENKGGA